MKLVVGGRAQGKTEFARALAAEAFREDGAGETMRTGGACAAGRVKEAAAGRGRGGVCAKEEAAYQGGTEADGRVDDVETAMRAAVILHVEAYVRRLMERGEDPFAFAERLLRENPEAVAAADEIGCGIVPADAFLRKYRETAGRVCQRLAAGSDEVYRVICGIGKRMK